MKRGITVIAALLLFELCVLAEEPEVMPPSAKDALNKMDQDIERAKEIAVMTLKKTLVEETKKGNLKTAVMIQEKIDELSVPESVLGRWTPVENRRYTYDLKENGDIIVNGGSNKGRWSVDKSFLTCVFPNGTFKLQFPPKDGVMNGRWSSSNSGGDTTKWKKD